MCTEANKNILNIFINIFQYKKLLRNKKFNESIYTKEN